MLNFKHFFLCLLFLNIGSLFGQTPDELLKDGYELYEDGEYKSVVELLSSLSKSDKKGEAEMLMGDAEHKMEFFEAAIMHYNSAEKAGVKSQALYFHRGAAYISIGEYKKAIKNMDKAIDLEPENAELFFYRGYAYTELDKPEKALADYSNAILYNPDYAEAYYNRGAIKIDLGLLDQGKEDLLSSQKIDGENLNISFNLAIIAYEKEEYADAAALFKKLTDTDDNDQKLDAYYYLAECSYQLNNIEDACRYFYKAMSLGDKDSEEIYHNYCEKGQIRKLFKSRKKTEKVTF